MELIANGFLRFTVKTIRHIVPSSYRINGYYIHSRVLTSACTSRTILTSDMKLPSVMLSVSRSFSGVPSSTSLNKDEDSLGTKALKLVGWMGGFYSRRATLTRSAIKMYQCCVEGVAYNDFYKAASMPDTFQSWFLVNQFHVWMCLVRLKPEGKNGQYMYRRLVRIFWEDVEERMKVMGVEDGFIRKNSLKELSQEFFGLIFAYDEGLLSHDCVLAASLWRNMFHDKKNTDASSLACFVDYVRKNIVHLESINSELLLTTGEIKWLPFEEISSVDKETSHQN